MATTIATSNSTRPWISKQRLRRRACSVEELVIPDDIHGFLLCRTWKTVTMATGEFFEKRFMGRAAGSSPGVTIRLSFPRRAGAVSCGGGIEGMRKPAIQVKRVYEPPSREDGVRMLVDRLWPRGLPKARASVDLWLKDIAPSLTLRRWFNRDPSRWAEFKRRYAEELDALHASSAAVAALTGAARCGKVTLLFGARDEQHNTAVALHTYLTQTELAAFPPVSPRSP